MKNNKLNVSIKYQQKTKTHITKWNHYNIIWSRKQRSSVKLSAQCLGMAMLLFFQYYSLLQFVGTAVVCRAHMHNGNQFHLPALFQTVSCNFNFVFVACIFVCRALALHACMWPRCRCETHVHFWRCCVKCDSLNTY